jgi:hypothetical protein
LCVKSKLLWLFKYLTTTFQIPHYNFPNTLLQLSKYLTTTF